MPAPSELFISHSDQDRNFATGLCRVLEQHGVPYWYSRRNVRGSQQWHNEIGTALSRCDWFLLILSPASVESMWVRRELLYALQQKRYDERIIPILHQTCDHQKLSWTLDSFQFVDFTQSVEAGCNELLRIWGLSYRAPAF